MVNNKRAVPLVIGNWKMHGSLTTNSQLLQQLSNASLHINTNMAVCVSYPYLQQCKDLLSNSKITWGAQDVSAHEQGAFTGEVSATMLAEFMCTYVLVGHSERRVHHYETDQLIAEKVVAVCVAGMTPVLCLGETWAQRQSGKTEQIVRIQLKTVFDFLSKKDLHKLVIAYEPIWAIGTGKTANAAEAQEVHAFLRSEIAIYDNLTAQNIPIIYGGSVKPENAQELFSMPDIDGGLIGGASLKAIDFLKIAQAY